MLNNLIAWAVTTGKIVLQSDGTPWRPIVHVEDICARLPGCCSTRRARRSTTQAFNVGADRRRTTASASSPRSSARRSPAARSPSPRAPVPTRATTAFAATSSRTPSPSFQLKWNARSGAREIYDAYLAAGLTKREFDGPRFKRLAHIRQLLDAGDALVRPALERRRRSRSPLEARSRWARPATCPPPAADDVVPARDRRGVAAARRRHRRRAAARARRSRSSLAGVERLDVLLTHYHLDHVVGLSYLLGLAARPADADPRARRRRSPTSGRRRSPADRAAALSAAVRPLADAGRGRPLLRVRSSRSAASRLRVRGARSTRAARSGVRLGDALAYVTDTRVDPATVEFVRGVKLLLHEVWLTEAEAAVDDPARTGHSAAGAVADLARRAGVGRLLPVHHHPKRTAEELGELVEFLAERSGRAVALPREGETLDLEG